MNLIKFLDVKKAVKTVDHDIIIEKLNSYGMRLV